MTDIVVHNERLRYQTVKKSFPVGNHWIRGRAYLRSWDDLQTAVTCSDEVHKWMRSMKIRYEILLIVNVGTVFRFNEASDAALFKLTWGGR